jgi:adenylosuccinate lyase
MCDPGSLPEIVPLRLSPGQCQHERGHIVDSIFHGSGYATPASRRIFCDRCRLQRWLHVEAALAISQAELGMIPAETAAEIVRACEPGRIDLDSLVPEFHRTGHSLVPLLRGIQAACEGTAGEMVHFGATTQDIQDTAQALEMREVLDETDRALTTMAGRIVELADAHRDSVMIGRTHGQPALPITFGLKAASWLDELLRHGERLAQLRNRVLVAQLFGGAGTMAGFQGRGRELLSVFAARLELGVPVVGWHSARDRVAEFGIALAMGAATLARIADEVRVLSRLELDEVTEGWEYGRVGSSTMPHKRNPERSEQVVVLARLARASGALVIEAMLQEHERDSRGLRMEWAALADVCHHTLAAFSLLNEVLADLQVHRDRMAEHADDAAEYICTEALMLALARKIGKQSAHTILYDVSQRAQSSGDSLRTCLLARSDISGLMTAADLDLLLTPARYLGEAVELTERSIEQGRRWLASRSPDTPPLEPATGGKVSS